VVEEHLNEIVCRELVELVTDHLEGALSPGALARVEEHLLLCEGCAAYVEQMRMTTRLLQALPSAGLAPSRREELLRAFRAR
jgi:anti-sigma factor RsiW